MFRQREPKVHVSFPRRALEAMFDECDKYDRDETGGKVIGTYRKNGRQYDIEVVGFIDAGPNAQRTPTSLFQDGDYQERVFRSLEGKYPDLEHLGSWHSHHGNGLATLSAGDRATYHRIVNHERHNTDFFYAPLVVRKTPGADQRYEIKHYIVFRSDDSIHEIPHKQIHIIEKPDASASKAEPVVLSFSPAEIEVKANPERVKDQEVLGEFYPSIKPGFSKHLGVIYWKGDFVLVDGSLAEVLAMENSDHGKGMYSITITRPKFPLSEVLERYKERSFRSARQAVFQLQRDLDQEIFRSGKG